MDSDKIIFVSNHGEKIAASKMIDSLQMRTDEGYRFAGIYMLGMIEVMENFNV